MIPIVIVDANDIGLTLAALFALIVDVVTSPIEFIWIMGTVGENGKVPLPWCR
ncbi:MAG: hypothetical protein HYR85_10955 [Planctomycetes bacterium]|nr:hypothetical protein [Planctomycetota bacterium]MBI3843407.1 hypothetical protein [Planctomycetota bacterium]